MATEKKTFLFNAKNGVMVANLTDTLKQTPDIMNNLDLTKFKVKEVEFDNTTHYCEDATLAPLTDLKVDPL